MIWVWKWLCLIDNALWGGHRQNMIYFKWFNALEKYCIFDSQHCWLELKEKWMTINWPFKAWVSTTYKKLCGTWIISDFISTVCLWLFCVPLFLENKNLWRQGIYSKETQLIEIQMPVCMNGKVLRHIFWTCFFKLLLLCSWFNYFKMSYMMLLFFLAIFYILHWFVLSKDMWKILVNYINNDNIVYI